MSLTKHTDGRVTFELNEDEVEAYVRAGIDRRIDEMLRRQYQMSMKAVVRDAVLSYISTNTEYLRTLVTDALGAWLSTREGWVATVISRGQRKTKTPVTQEDLCVTQEDLSFTSGC